MDTVEMDVVLAEVFKKARPYVEIYYMYMDKWLDGRRCLIKSFKEIADEIDKKALNTNIAITTGATVATIGIGVSIASLLIPPVGLIGLSVSLIGGITSTGAAFAQGSIVKTKMDEANNLIQEDQAIYRKIEAALRELDKAAKEARHALMDSMPTLTQDQIYGIILTKKNIPKGVKGCEFVYKLIKVVALRNLSAGAAGGARMAFAAGRVVRGFGRLASKGLLFISIPLTVMDLVSGIKGLVDRSAASRELRELTARIEEEYEEMKKVHTAIEEMAEFALKKV